jgi:hypothetical protein
MLSAPPTGSYKDAPKKKHTRAEARVCGAMVGRAPHSMFLIPLVEGVFPCFDCLDRKIAMAT